MGRLNALALPSQQILLPRFELPAWVRKIGDPLRMGQIAQGGIYGGLNAGAVGLARGGIQTLILDNFTDTNGTPLASHVIAPTNIPATSWVVTSSNISIQSNRASATTFGYALANAGISNLSITSIVQSATGNFAGIILRASDVNNLWLVQINPGGATSWRLTERNAGVNTTRASGSPTILTATDYTVVVSASGDTLSVTLNGANLLTYSSSFNNNATKVGLYMNGIGQFDNFTVATL